MIQRDPAVAVVGAGMSGLCVAIALLRSGITDVTIYEKADEVRGTWRENTYPGLVCDIPSRIYQYTFARNPDWSHLFSPGAEIQAYFSGVADRFGLRDRIRFGTEIVDARFDDGQWVIRTAGRAVSDHRDSPAPQLHVVIPARRMENVAAEVVQPGDIGCAGMVQDAGRRDVEIHRRLRSGIDRGQYELR